MNPRSIPQRTTNETSSPTDVARRLQPARCLGLNAGLVLLVALTACRHTAAQTPRIVHQAFPDITFRTALDETVRTADLRDDVVLVALWTTDCKTCTELRDAAEKWGQSLAVQRVTVLGINEDPAEASWKAFMVQHPSPLIEVWDKNHALRDAVGLREVPALVLVDRMGQVRSLRRRWSGATEADVSGQLHELVREPRP